MVVDREGDPLLSKIKFILLLVHVCAARVEVREQLLGVGSPLPPQVPGVELRLSDHVASFSPSEPALTWTL